MAIKKKISQLPECRDFNGLYTIGVDGSRKSVKVSLGYIAEVVSGMQSATTAANTAASTANTAAQRADTSRHQIEANEQTRISQENARVQAETNRQTTWNNWFSDTLATGVRKLWNDFWSSINNSWNGFFGTSAEDANGVRKIWSTWYSNVQSSWTSFFGSNPNGGVRGEWASLKSDAQAATNAANQKAALANEKAALANEKAALANEKAILANEKAGLANNAADNANTQAGRAKEYADHPPMMGDNGNWWEWDEVNDEYKDTGILAKGGILYPSFQVNTETMHLIMSYQDEIAADMFNLDKETGHLYFNYK